MADLPSTPLFAGLAAAALALLAWFADRRRMRRSDPDAVGFMPWTTVFFWAFLATVLLLGLAAKEWLGR
jgi:hypothetical protein